MGFRQSWPNTEAYCDVLLVEKVHAVLSKAEREENLKKFVQANFHER